MLLLEPGDATVLLLFFIAWLWNTNAVAGARGCYCFVLLYCMALEHRCCCWSLGLLLLCCPLMQLDVARRRYALARCGFFGAILVPPPLRWRCFRCRLHLNAATRGTNIDQLRGVTNKSQETDNTVNNNKTNKIVRTRLPARFVEQLVRNQDGRTN